MKTALRFIAQMMLLLVAAAGVLLAVAPASSQAQNNTYYGAGALQSGTKTGSSDSAFGVNALYKNTTGANNTADGVSALFNNSTGGSNTASGVNALYKNTTGANNTAIGVSALLSNTTGGLNTAAGVNALKANTTGSGNTAYGANAMFNSTTDGNETALGFEALFSDKTGFGGMPNQNVAVGYQALFSSTDGFENLASGYQALYFSTSGDDNTAIGWQALLRITTGASNIGIGHGAGSALTTGSANIDIGHPGLAGDTKIIRIGDGVTQTATYLTGVIHGNGSGLTGVSQLAANAVQAGNIAAGAVGSTQLASGLTLAGVTTGEFSGNGSGLTGVPASAVTGTIPATLVGTPPPGMVLIPAGSYTMGNSVAADTDITDATPIAVTVSAFYMDANLVTLGQWQSVYFWATSNGYTFNDAGGGVGARNPVYNVDWWNCVKWCNARSQQAHLTPVYYTDAGFTTVYQTGDPSTVYMNMAAGGYRLPTEAEWEKAARGGLSGQRFPWGDTITENLANYYGDTGDYSYDLGPNGFNALDTDGTTNGSTTPIGTFPANGYGLYDMAGNIFEWCWDWYGTPYGQPTTTNPTGPTSGSVRVLRGGDWNNGASLARCANRINGNPVGASNYIGFRSVLSPGQP